MRYLVIFALLSSCSATPTRPPVPPATQACAAACDRLDQLGCAAGQPTPDGTICEVLCEQTEVTGWTTMHPRCVATALTCDEADRMSADGCQ